MSPLKKITSHANAHRHFFKAWVQAPLTMGAIVPSSGMLARAMAEQVMQLGQGYVVELGAGTGVMTRALLERGVCPERLIVIERDMHLYHLLCQRFPGVHVLHADAARLSDALQKFGSPEVHTVISSLPLLSIPRPVQQAIIGEVFQVLAPKGKLVQFTYGPRSPVPRDCLRKYHLHERRVQRIWRNVPPATIWCYERNEY